ncbi:hypothetical protein HYH03_009804 [Edaphochlamys debaryana]|uniref:Uncharacterized protein n=1 Tax=Edaphochlamys debaryana TaxID=47281 RepID=A0A836BY25_9CHLO|nr:hypothetical protein HYH03_009804 [Edaphochlamys debaryana]|eukprot:KAG2491848.1 hypothetical protein HYH03_009804 [Edaphochlamys debaryana]
MTSKRPAWVALYSYLRVAPTMRTLFDPTADPSDSVCLQAYHQVSLHLKKSRLVVAAAQGFIAGVLAPAAEGRLPAPPPPPAARGSNRTLLSSSSGDSTTVMETSQAPGVSRPVLLGAPAAKGPQQKDPEAGPALRKASAPSPTPAGLSPGLSPAKAASSAAAPSASARSWSAPSSKKRFFVAMHVRPHPDSCMEYYATLRKWTETAAKKVCTNPRFLSDLVVRLRAIAAERAAAAVKRGPTPTPASNVRPAAAPQSQPALTVFVMSHPTIRTVVRSEVARLWSEHEAKAAKQRQQRSKSAAPAALPAPTLVFLDSGQLPAALRDHVAHTSLLSMVEQEVCRAAPVFLGTTLSSISVLVAQERAAEAAQAGVTEHHKHTELLH